MPRSLYRRSHGISIHSLRMEGDRSECRGEHQNDAISIHSLRMEGDWKLSDSIRAQCNFNPLPPYGGRLLRNPFPVAGHGISIHSLRMEGDFETSFASVGTTGISIHSLRMEGDSCWMLEFRKTLISIHSLRMEGDSQFQCSFSCRKHFNPLPPYGGRPAAIMQHVDRCLISIHSLRMEGDGYCFYRRNELRISIHSLRMEGDQCLLDQCRDSRGFQSTPSVWRETLNRRLSLFSRRNFNPLPPYGGRPGQLAIMVTEILFQSTPSVWRETKPVRLAARYDVISIHSLRMEGDCLKIAIGVE